MPLPGLYIIDPPAPEASLTSRADVALFVGLVARSKNPLPEQLKQLLARAGWINSKLRTVEQIQNLLDVPVPIDSFAQFNMLFAVDDRPVDPGMTDTVPTSLGAAVRSFFNEGGVKCYVVRCGDPIALRPEPNETPDVFHAKREDLIASQQLRLSERAPLIPGWSAKSPDATADDRSSWHGIAHLYGLDEVAMLSIPDLPDLFSIAPQELPDEILPKSPKEIFRPCDEADVVRTPAPKISRVTAARLDELGFKRWASAVSKVLGFLETTRGGTHRRDVMLIAGLPLPAKTKTNVYANVELNPLELLTVIANKDGDEYVLTPSRLLQLAYPWVKTASSAAMPEGIENPEGVVTGVLARNALMRGAFHSAAALPLPSVRGTLPVLERAQLEANLDKFASWLGDRVSLVGRAVTGFQLLSDATMSQDVVYRSGCVSRLMGIIIRAGRMLGQELVFEGSSEPTWTRLRRRIEEFLSELWRLGGLNGASPGEAFEVRCGRATMSQADIDAGRLIAEIRVVATQPIETLSVTLSLGGNQASRRAA